MVKLLIDYVQLSIFRSPKRMASVLLNPGTMFILVVCSIVIWETYQKVLLLLDKILLQMSAWQVPSMFRWCSL